MKKTLSVIFFILVIFINYLANALPIGGITTGEASALLDNLFTPAGFTFSIWGIIYLLLLIFIISVITFSKYDSTLIDDVLTIFNINCILNILWIFAWHYRLLPLSLIIMFGLLTSLFLIVKKVKIYEQSSENSYILSLTKISFNIYFGWITVATVANFTALMVYYNWNGFSISPELWTFLIILISMVISTITFYTIRSNSYLFPIIWAYFGIFSKYSPNIVEFDLLLIRYSLVFGMLFLSILVLTQFISNFRKFRLS